MKFRFILWWHCPKRTRSIGQIKMLSFQQALHFFDIVKTSLLSSVKFFLSEFTFFKVSKIFSQNLSVHFFVNTFAKIGRKRAFKVIKEDTSGLFQIVLGYVLIFICHNISFCFAQQSHPQFYHR